MLSMKQAARRPRPPLPSAASGSTRRRALEIDAELGERRARRCDQSEIAQAVEQEPPDQELQGEVIDALLPALVGGAGRVHPAVDDVVTHGEGRGREPVMVARAVRVLADRIGQLGEDRLLEGGDVRLARAGLVGPRSRGAGRQGQPLLVQHDGVLRNAARRTRAGFVAACEPSYPSGGPSLVARITPRGSARKGIGII